MQTPALADLSPATPLQSTLDATAAGSFVPGQLLQPNSPADIAWSEYNHHWAGMIVLAIGILSLLAVASMGANWPLPSLGWVLPPRSRRFGELAPGTARILGSFQVAEVAQHRVFVLLIVHSRCSNGASKRKALAEARAGLVFPDVCAAGGALLLTHSHSLGNVKEEFLAELSHIPIAILAVVVGAGPAGWNCESRMDRSTS